MKTSLPHLDETVVATARYLEALTELSDEDLAAPSVLPGWTRGHVVAHLSRNADALVNLLEGAQRGETGSMYPSQEQRDADIGDWSSRGAAALHADAASSSDRWAQAARGLRELQLDEPGSRLPGGPTFPVRRVGAMRLTEVEVHHADLGLDYTAADWPAPFVEALMKRRQRELTASGPAFTWVADDLEQAWTSGEGPEVRGASADLAWWLLGRGDGAALRCSDGDLPELGRWA